VSCSVDPSEITPPADDDVTASFAATVTAVPSASEVTALLPSGVVVSAAIQKPRKPVIDKEHNYITDCESTS